MDYGWILVDRGSEGPAAWSRFRLERGDELWEAVLVIISLPILPHTHYLAIAAEKLR